MVIEVNHSLMGANSNNKKDPEARFWADAILAVAKSATLLAIAEESVSNNDYSSAAVNAYYGLLHLSFSLMWLLPESILDVKMKEELIAIRDRGGELPARRHPTHSEAEQFIDGICNELGVSKFPIVFRESRVLREFISYGPRIHYDGEQPIAGLCKHSPGDVRKVVIESVELFSSVLKATWSLTAYGGILGAITVEESIGLLFDSQLPFYNWHPEQVLVRASEIICSTV